MDRVIDHDREDFATGERRDDVILDIGGFDRQIRAMLLSPFVWQRLGTFVSTESAEDLAVLKELIEAGKVTPVIDRTYPLAEAPDAIRYVEEGRARGKVAIRV
ncbi:hypothetical protein GCM10009844_16620 [Nocardioides koreensis]|uniref:Zinc-binding dehydrogenase n=1 Tax=Nocardioides koreensis TaxID=433651 RepID=A0ABP5LCR5_9ACTN